MVTVCCHAPVLQVPGLMEGLAAATAKSPEALAQDVMTYIHLNGDAVRGPAQPNNL